MSTKRLLKERASLEKNPIEYCTFSFPSDDVQSWQAHLTGPPKTPYSGGTFLLSLSFPTQYPFKPPEIKFQTKIYHPNVKGDTGEICNTLITDGWGPTLNIRHCIQVIRNIMENPDPDNPLEDDIARQLREKPNDFKKMATKSTKE
eukprot:894989_1